MLPRFAYVRPGTLSEAIEHLREDGARPHAGGTDLLGCLRDEVLGTEKVVSLRDISELRGITREGSGGLRIGALTTVAEIAGSDLVRDLVPGLAQAAAVVASPQIRNQGTLGGNLCQRPRCWYFRGEFHCLKKGGDTCFAADGQNQYHALFGGFPCFIVHPSDLAPMLVAVGASVRTEGPDGERVVPLARFFQLPEERLDGENVLGSGEILREVVIPLPPAGSTSSYRKARDRGAWDFALASVALAVTRTDGRVATAAVVLGGVAPVPWRAEAAEKVLVGAELGPQVATRAAEAAVAGAAPLEHNGYKVELVKGLVEESLLAL